MRIAFLGNTFPAARAALRELLPADEVEVWSPDGRGDGADVLIPAMGRVDAALMDAAAPQLIQQFGAGLEGVDLSAAATRGIPVANVPAGATGNAAAVAELAVLHLLALSRRLDAARQAIAERRLGEPVGRGLAGQTATVVGLGSIGRELVRRLRPFGVQLIGVGRRPAAELDAEVAGLVDGYRRIEELELALCESDMLILCAPLSEETRGLIGRRELAALRPGAVLVNVGRGGLIDRDALLDALESRHLAGAGLDVFWNEPPDPDDPLLRQAVIATPHVGGVTDQAYRATARAFAANVERLRRREPIENRVV